MKYQDPTCVVSDSVSASSPMKIVDFLPLHTIRHTIEIALDSLSVCV